MTTVYGIKTCDTCRKAIKALRDAGQVVTLHDVRATPLGSETLTQFWDRFGDALMNTKSTTWRGLDADEKVRPPAELLAEYPTLMKRPVIDGPGGLTLGWTEDVRARQLG